MKENKYHQPRCLTKRKVLNFWIFFLILVTGPQLLPAFDLGRLGLYITNETLFQYNKIPENKNQFYEALSLFANLEKWSLGITLRGNNFFKQTSNQILPEAQLDLYRKYIQYNSRYFKVNIGDFYTILGQGLVLSVLKNEDILRERTILGGDIRYDKGHLNVRIVGGKILDETKEQEWGIGGGEVIWEYIKNHRIGAHFSFVDDIDTQTKLGERIASSLSFKGSRLLKYWSYYMELAHLYYRTQLKDNGYGIYSNLTYNKSHINCFLEFKHYKDFNNEVNNPPAADRSDEIASIMSDTTGVRLYFQYSFFEPDIVLFFNIGGYREYDDWGNHVYGGFNMEDLMERLSLSLTYGIRDILYPVKRWDGHLLYRLTDRLSSEFTWKDRRYKNGKLIFNEQDFTLQISYSPYVSIFMLYQYSHNRILNLNHFYSGGVAINFTSSTVFEISGGTVRGGEVCSGGQCFITPPFKGFKCSLLHTFN